MSSKIVIFQEEYPSLESYWRSIILFGRNTTSYKFALAKSLIEIVQSGKAEISLEELAIPYVRNICEHIAIEPKQSTTASSSFLEACKDFNDNAIGNDELIEITMKKGFKDVLDAFHIVNRGELPVEFYRKDFSGGSKKIILTDEAFRLQEKLDFSSFENEVEARWRLVETAWAMGVSQSLMKVGYDKGGETLFTDLDSHRRKNVTSAKDALNGYQKGKCFYCFDDISVVEKSESCCEVDHFFPHTLKSFFRELNLNGVWNLVLSCRSCNRGLDGKFAKVPGMEYLERLYRRNEYLISSHHPLRETIISQTGSTEKKRKSFLGTMDHKAINILIHRWSVKIVGEEVF